jgi:hypothetical protein
VRCIAEMDIVVSKDEIKEYEKLKVIAETTLTKEKLKLFEKKYQSTFKEFEKKVKGGEGQENFEEWDDYIEWKAYEESLRNLRQRSKAIDDARNIKVA